METLQELKDAIKEGGLLVWNDPDPIPNNDYLISEVFGVDKMEKAVDDGLVENEDWCDWPILIHYGETEDGTNSEAEVLLSEIDYARERHFFIVNDRLADAQEEICQNLYDESISKVYDYGNKVNMPYSYCIACETDTPTIVRLESDTCAVCGSDKEIQEEYEH